MRMTPPMKHAGPLAPTRAQVSAPQSAASGSFPPSSAIRARAQSSSESGIQLRPSATGFVGLLPRPAPPPPSSRPSEPPPFVKDFLDELTDEPLLLTTNILCIEHIVRGMVRDPAARAAAHSVRARLKDLLAMRRALRTIHLDARDRRMAPLLQPDAPLRDYLRGLYAWCEATARALEGIALSLCELDTDWTLARARLDDARTFYLEELEAPIRKQCARLRRSSPQSSRDIHDPLYPIGEHIDELFWAAARLSTSLDKRFG